MNHDHDPSARQQASNYDSSDSRHHKLIGRRVRSLSHDNRIEHKQAITHWPKDERPREKLLRYGVQTLSNAELIAIVLHSGTAQCSALDLARQLLQRFASLGALLSADHYQLSQIHGIGLAKSVQLQVIRELAQRQLEEQISAKRCLNSSDLTREYFRLRYQHCAYEVFSCAFLDSQFGLISVDELFRGSISQSHIYPRELVQRCLQHRAAAVIFVHNHPSGSSEPSQADIAITQRLRQVLTLIEIKVLDHLIVGEQVSSFADSGLL